MMISTQTLILGFLKAATRMVVSCVMCALLMGVSSAKAVDGALMTGKTLALLCNSAKPEDQFSCQSYIAGVIDYHRLLKSLGTAPSVDFCLPRDTKMVQIKATIVQYMIKHTEHQDFIAAPGVAMSLFNAWPCVKRKK